jgi:hypothetical protein
MLIKCSFSLLCLLTLPMVLGVQSPCQRPLLLSSHHLFQGYSWSHASRAPAFGSGS